MKDGKYIPIEKKSQFLLWCDCYISCDCKIWVCLPNCPPASKIKGTLPDENANGSSVAAVCYKNKRIYHQYTFHWTIGRRFFSINRLIEFVMTYCEHVNMWFIFVRIIYLSLYGYSRVIKYSILINVCAKQTFWHHKLHRNYLK